MKRKIPVWIAPVALLLCAAALQAIPNESYALGDYDVAAVREILPGDEAFVLGGEWQYPDIASTSTAGNTVSYTGTFTHITWCGQADDNMGTAIVRIDGTEITRTRPNRGESGDDHVVYQSDILERGEHTFTLECVGDGWLSVQKFIVTDDTQQTAIKRLYDDASADIAYNGFGSYTGQAALHEGTVHSTNAAGATATLTVKDVKRFVVYTDRGFMRGKAEVYIDGVKTDTVDLFDGVNALGSYISYVSPELSLGEHTLEWRCTGTKSKNATDVWVTLDRIDAYLWREPITVHDFDDTCFGYNGQWQYFGNEADTYYMNSVHSTQNAGDEMTAVFSGVEGIRIYASQAPDRRSADVWLNGKKVGVIDERSASPIPSGILWNSGALPLGDYQLKLTVRGGNGGEWFEIDKIQTDGINGDNMMIHSGNDSFVKSSFGTVYEDNEDALFGRALVLKRGQSATAVCKGSFAELHFLSGKTGDVEISVDGSVLRTVSVSDGPVAVRLGDLERDKFHRIVMTVIDGEVWFDRIVTDDVKLETLKAYMIERAKSEIEQRVDGTKKVSDPAEWSPVAFAANKPIGGVSLDNGAMSVMFVKAIDYFSDSLKKDMYVDNIEWWVTTLRNSNEGRMLAGLAGILTWTEAPEFEKELDELLSVIRARQLKNGNGYCLDYPESVLAGNADSAEDERRNYDRAMFVKGLVAAGDYYNAKGVDVNDNTAYTILWEFFDWYNYNTNKYGEHMLEGVLGLQGHIAGTAVYFTPVGKTEDMTYSELCYVQDWWMECLSGGITDSVWDYPLNRSHCYITTGIDAYLDHYRATGDPVYLDACLGYWEMMHRYFIHTGGAMAICEFGKYYPGSYYLDGANHTGELCGTAFWIDFNYKLLQLFPGEEKYAREIEEGIYNVMRAAQDEKGKIRYHARYNGSLAKALNTNTCCEVNGAALLARLPEFVYLLEDGGVRVNLYESSTLDVDRNGKHFALRQTSDILNGDRSVIRVLGDGMTLTLRVPSWSRVFTVKINGEQYSGEIPSAGGYISLSVETDDEIEITAVKELTAVEYGGMTVVKDRTRSAYTYGPILLAVRPCDPDRRYVYSVHGKSENGADELALDIGMSSDAFLSGLKYLGSSHWVFETDGRAVYELIPYGELTSNDFFSVFPLFGGNGGEDIMTAAGETLGFKFTQQKDCEQFEIYSSLPSAGIKIIDGALVTSSECENKIILDEDYDQSEIEVTVGARSVRGKPIDIGLYFNAAHATDTQDKINAINLQAVRRDGEGEIALNLYEFGSERGFIGTVKQGASICVLGDEITVKLVIKDKKMYGYLNDVLLITYEYENSFGYAKTGIRTQYAETEITQFTVKNSDVKLPSDPTDPDDPKDPVGPADPDKPGQDTPGKNTQSESGGLSVAGAVAVAAVAEAAVFAAALVFVTLYLKRKIKNTDR